MIRRTFRVPLFFIILLLSLCIPDGIQSASDMFWPIVTLACIPLWEYHNTQTVWKSKTEILLWALVFGALLISTCLSWSPGYSISSIMRICVGLVWLKRFTLLTRQEKDRIPRILAYCAVSVVCMGLLPYALPVIPIPVPAFSSLWAPAGYLPFISLTVPLIPVMVAAIYAKQYAHRRMLFILAAALIIGSSLLSFSRAAMVLIALYCGVLLFSSRGKTKKIFALSGIVISAGVLVSLFWISTRTPFEQQRLHLPAAVRPFIIKNTVPADARLAYIHQGIRAFRTSPLFGTGPGTFSYVSKQFGASLYDVSDYAHMIVLEILTETGSVGAAAIFALTLYYVMAFIRAKKKYPEEHTHASGYVWAVGGIIALGFVEPNMHHYPVFLLCMVMVGIISGTFWSDRPKRSPGLLPFLVLMGLMTLSWIGSDIAFTRHAPTLSLYLAPYRQSAALRLIASSARLTERTATYIDFFHPHDDAIALSISRRAHTYPLWNTWITKAMREYPSNTALQTEYLMVLATHMPPQETCTAIRTLTRSPLLPCMTPLFLTYFQSMSYRQTIPLWNGPFGQSKFLYFVGKSVLSVTDRDTIAPVIAFWTRAKDLALQWPYFHVELASLTAYDTGTDEGAMPVLTACLSHPSARNICQQYILDIHHIPAPGLLSHQIEEIPFGPVTP